MPHKPGDVVRIYDDPLTEQKFEAEAKLVEKMLEEPEREYWLVEFTKGHERHPRWIKKYGSEKGAHTYYFLMNEGLPTEERLTVDADSEPEAVIKARDEFTRRRGVYHKTARITRRNPDGERASGFHGAWMELQQKELDLEAEIAETKDPEKLKRLQEELADVRGRQTQELQQRELEVEEAAKESMHLYRMRAQKGTYMSALEATTLICTAYDQFIGEEEKGIRAYEDLLRTIQEALNSLSPDQQATRDILDISRTRINRILAEERMHLDVLRMLKQSLCP